MSLDIRTLAKRYAKATFELADEQDQLDSVYSELTSLRQVYVDNPGLASAFSGVDLSVDDKKQLLTSLQKGTSELVNNLLQMLFDYGRLSILVEIVDDFERRYDARRKLMHAKVTTAVALSDSQKSALKDNLAQRFGASEIDLQERVDPQILGGVIVSVNHQTLDGSIRTKIEQIRRLLQH